ncbi:FKBP-type peptidyl-prolyl cis-trans isomerase [Luteimonas notoginsengisoli]|jgi:FKBP-type peptidyl-prolyl cis-trans isomerase FkpA/FKBP-type peptidyl-prolyl cis-trans isomerase FklB|uniref:Peptidyl-prolyl cis-trans isomerase n=1 Tax=Luteimonas notoginsengisoli TaxID=1578200 RepID=A0ABV7URA6_9GAMM
MTSRTRFAVASLLAASLAFGFAACKPIDEDAKKDDKSAADANSAGGADIAKSSGLKTDKEQASYMVGMSVGKSLEPIKDEVDMDTLIKAMKTMMSGGKPLLTDEQAQQVAQAFDQRLQAKKVAEAEAASKKNASEGEAFLAANAKKPGVKTTASGLQYQVLTEGKGPKPAADAMVKVHYKGELLDGTEFDSSHDRGEPAVFSLQQVAPGWAEGVQLMPVGSKYKLWIPSKLGYGEQGTPGGPIPPNATLVFEVELLDIVKPDAAPEAKN